MASPLTVGPIVGPILNTTEDASYSVNAGGGFDVALGDLFFHIAATDETPYKRATAQFRKDQVDTGSSVGDQSLTGWWTRGQFSFHSGAGVRYYDVSQGNDTIENRFYDGSGVDPFTPGEVALRRAWRGSGDVLGDCLGVGTAGGSTVLQNGSDVLYGDAGDLAVYGGGASIIAEDFTTSPTHFYILEEGQIHRVDPSDGTGTIVYEGENLAGIWYVKDRLIVVDESNTFYQLAPLPTDTLPVAISEDDVVFKVTDADPDGWRVAETPGPVLMANGHRVFAVAATTDGSLPTLTAPLQVAELPRGESINAIRGYLGFVVLNTNLGCRVGVATDSGLTYGPVLIDYETAPAVSQIGVSGTRALVAGNGQFYEIDLGQQIGSTLEFAWVGHSEPFESQANYGAFDAEDGYGAWASDTLLAEDDEYEAGWLTTGFHRFGTMEGKRFDSVSVRAAGAGGTIAVYRVDASGNELLLYTLDVSQGFDITLDLNMTGQAEMVALKFALAPSSGDASVAPKLLGYQLRALPSPKRHRLIQVPVLVYDQTRRQPARGTGRRGGAWSRLKALENLESDKALVLFRDFRTGETATVFVETVEFTDTTPPSAGSKGFGGIALITLRKLS